MRLTFLQPPGCDVALRHGWGHGGHCEVLSGAVEGGGTEASPALTLGQAGGEPQDTCHCDVVELLERDDSDGRAEREC